MGKQPAILLYDGDWVKDAVAGCSLAAQGLWLRMMFIGHNSERYGYLQQNGVAMPPGSIARRCGCTLAEYTSLLSELDAASVPSRTPDGIIYSRRMVRDAIERAKAKQRKQKSRSCHASVTPIEDEREVDVGLRVVDSASDVAAFVLDGMGINGRESRWLAEDAIKAAMRRFTGSDAMKAAELIVQEWEAYRACPDIEDRFKAGPTKFLKESLFDRARWRTSGGIRDAIRKAFEQID